MKPILFNTEMVKAILDGRKTVTRRILKFPKRIEDCNDGTYTIYAEGTGYPNQCMGQVIPYLKPPYNVGDILYIRETFCPNYFDDCIASLRNGNKNAYKADYNKSIVGDVCPEPKWNPSIHMPKEAARIFLRVTDVRVERLQDINIQGNHDEILKEGYPFNKVTGNPVTDFILLWNNNVNGKWQGQYCWSENPWVWAIEFERISKEDAYAERN